MHKFFIFPSLSILLLLFSFLNVFAQDEPGFVQINVYHYHDSMQQRKIHEYLKNAYLPILHENNLQAGIFASLTNDTAAVKKVFVISYADKVGKLPAFQWATFTKNSNDYLDAPFDQPSFDRLETILLRCFDEAPGFGKPDLKGEVSQRIYELRSYESASEKLHESKVKMFNDGGEVELFERLNFNALFYGWVIAGAKKPNLMYMTSFNSMTERDAHWKAFFIDPVWKKIVAMPEYQHNVSKADIWLLNPADYSDY